ncbi:hypothetical protein Ait01nite_068020 [Actinoplanes italicus]|nr:hypothetical protein Ait01nite_068020 [Actinoplanes italicus]
MFGGALLLVLTVALQPALDTTGCSNYGGNGNGTAFSDGIWDLIYPGLLFSWMLAVLVEQFVPVTWKRPQGDRDPGPGSPRPRGGRCRLVRCRVPAAPALPLGSAG